MQSISLDEGVSKVPSSETHRPFICMLLQNRYDMDARVKREARTLASKYRVRVVHLCGENQAPGFDVDVDAGGEVEIERVELWSRKLPRNAIFWIFKYLELIVRMAWIASRLRPDGFHAHDLPMVIPAYLASKVHSVPIVYDSHELYSETGQDPPAIAWIWRQIDKWAVRRVQRVIAVNQSRAEVMIEELGSPPPVVVPNYPVYQPVDGHHESSDSPLRKFVDKELGPGIPIVLYQGIIAPGRELMEIIRAMAVVEARAVLVLLGPRTDYVENLIELVAELNLENRVLYHEGVNSDVLPAYTVGATIGVVTYADSPRNNFLCAPNKLFEYCMANVPVIGCNFPEITRLLDEFAAGERFDSGDPVSIAEAIDNLLGDSTRLQEARDMTNAVREKYHWGRAASELYGIYDDILSASNDQ